MNKILIYFCVLRKYISTPIHTAKILLGMSHSRWMPGRIKMKLYEGEVELIKYISKKSAETAVSLYEINIKEPANS